MTPPAGVALLARRPGQPGRLPGGHAPERRAASTSTATRAPRWRPLDRRGGTYCPGPGRSPSPSRRRSVRLVSAASGRTMIDLVPPARARWSTSPAATVGSCAPTRGCVGLPLGPPRAVPGHDHRLAERDVTRHTTAFVVELPAGRLPRAAVARHVAAVLAVARANTRGLTRCVAQRNGSDPWCCVPLVQLAAEARAQRHARWRRTGASRAACRSGGPSRGPGSRPPPRWPGRRRSRAAGGPAAASRRGRCRPARPGRAACCARLRWT